MWKDTSTSLHVSQKHYPETKVFIWTDTGTHKGREVLSKDKSLGD